MKSLFLLLTLLLTYQIQAQTQDTAAWSPTGATWVYRVPAQFARPYMKFQYDGDTLIQDQASKKIHCYSFEYVGPSSGPLHRTPDQYLDTKFMYQSGDSVYILVRDTFRTIYVFSAQAGDSWEITETGDYTLQNTSLPATDLVTVLGVNTLNIGGTAFTELSMAGGNSWRIGSSLLKNIGSTESFLPLPVTNNNSEVICDASSLMSGLDCYYDQLRGILGNSSTPDQTCEELMSLQPDTLNVPIVENSHKIHYYPNPSFSQLTVDIQHQTSTTRHYLRIYNTMGQVVSVQQISNQQNVDISHLPAGTYLFLVENPYFSQSFKIVKL